MTPRVARRVTDYHHSAFQIPEADHASFPIVLTGILNIQSHPSENLGASSKFNPRSASVLSRFAGSKAICMTVIVYTITPRSNVSKPRRCYRNLTMRLSDAGLRQRQTKALYPNHRLPPWLTEDATRDRSNRLLGDLSQAQYLLLGALKHTLQPARVTSDGRPVP
jgi:hypothetical protein